jgi:hypothetical protein
MYRVLQDLAEYVNPTYYGVRYRTGSAYLRVKWTLNLAHRMFGLEIERFRLGMSTLASTTHCPLQDRAD